MTRYDPAIVREVMRENAPKLLAIIAQVQQATSTLTKTVNTERRNAA